MEPVTLTVLGAEALKQGIQFFYAQAGELLKRWRERRDGEDPDPTVAVAGLGSAVLAAAPESLRVDFDALDKLEPKIRALRASLADYAEGIETVDSSPELLKVTDALRCAIEAATGGRLTLSGEDRPADHDIDVEIDVGTVGGEVAGVIAECLDGLKIRASINVDQVDPGARVVAVEEKSRPSPTAPDQLS